MLCYKDKTFCPFFKECKDGETCSRAYTEKIIQEAKYWKMPCCVFSEKPKCFKHVREIKHE